MVDVIKMLRDRENEDLQLLHTWYKQKYGWIPSAPQGSKPGFGSDCYRDWVTHNELWCEYQDERQAAKVSDSRKAMYLAALLEVGREPDVAGAMIGDGSGALAAHQLWTNELREFHKRWSFRAKVIDLPLAEEHHISSAKWWSFKLRYMAWWRLQEKIDEVRA